ncbi:MAG: NAD(+) synthase [Clostridia bacterium]|nr:NAD(+) synthase [Clostridia bacterium]
MKHGFLRVAAHTPALRVGDCRYNAQQITECINNATDTALVVFPELCLTGSTCGDLFHQEALLRGAEEALTYLLRQTKDCDSVVVVGLPVALGSAVYNCAAVCLKGELLGLVPKTALSAEESRWFADGAAAEEAFVTFAGCSAYFCANTVFTCEALQAFSFIVQVGGIAGVENTDPNLASAATVIVNLSAERELVARRDYLRSLVTVQSARLHCAYVLANAGEGESSADYVYAGGNLIAENGTLLCETQPYTNGAAVTELDLEHLLHDHRTAGKASQTVASVWFDLPVKDITLTRTIDATPFVPTDPAARCEEILSIQAAGLARRLSHTGSQAVVGLSGGLDSALALLVIVRAYQKLGRPLSDITAVTMPCFGTTGRTYRNACALAKACGATLREVSIADAVNQHFKDIGHNGTYDVTYENSQARERTQVLMDIANQSGALVIGTGDLSELVLGWATYNGDHMSMYGVNGSIPKTLVRVLVNHVAQSNQTNTELYTVLKDILDTPVSPELLPPENGDIAQKTEQIVGNYDLHDFFLYHILRWGSAPSRVYRLACHAFEGRFTPEEIKTWLCVFLRRFFTQQFKRNCLPDGPAVGSISVSPRGGWQMPSDAVVTLWLHEAETL